jgi:dCMP deaminase
MSRQDMMIAITRIVAQRGTCMRAKVGCVIELQGRILSIGYNGSEPGALHCEEVGCEIVNDHCIRTIHAEANAIAWAARKGISVEAATLWVYGWHSGSCPTCTKLAMSAGISLIQAIPLI